MGFDKPQKINVSEEDVIMEYGLFGSVLRKIMDK